MAEYTIIINIGCEGRGGHFDHAHGRKTCKAGPDLTKLKQSVAKFSPRTESCIVFSIRIDALFDVVLPETIITF